MSQAAPPTPRVGPYRLERPAGRGGMGEVFRAWDERLDRPVALKRVRPGAGEARRQLADEARALAAVDHPAVVRVHDLVSGDDGDWLVLEWVEGETLAAALRRGPLATGEAVTVGRQVAAALAAVHARGLVHGDLKAENVLLSAAGQAKVVDFGLAGAAGAAEQGLAGTPRCLPPERLLGGAGDPRGDLFAFGVLLYEALAGRSPFLGGDDEETFARIAAARPRPLAELRPGVPPALDALVRRLLAGEPAARPASAAAVVAELDRLAPAAAWPDEGQPTIAPGAAAPGPRAVAVPPRRARRLAPALAGVALAVAAAAGMALRWAPGPAPAAAPPAATATAPAPRVAVPLPRLSGPPSPAADLLADAVRLAALRALAAVPGAAPLPFDAVDAPGGSPLAAARAAAADEVLALGLSCDGASCRLTIERLEAAGGVVRAAETVEVPPEDPALAARAVEARVLSLYGSAGRPAVAAGAADAPLSAADAARFLALWRRARSGSAVALADTALPELGAMRARSPRFLDAYLLEIELRRKRWGETGSGDDLDRALALADAAAALFPDRPEPREERALLLLEAGRPAEARQALGELAVLAPGSADLAYLEARVAEAEGDPAAALALLRRLVDERPSWRRLHGLAALEVRQGLSDDARTHLHQLLELAPANYEGRSLLAQVELLDGDPAVAAALYGELAAESPGYAESTNLGLAHLLAGDWPAAVAALEAARRLDPESPFATLNLADAALLAGETERAEALYSEVLAATRPSGDGGGLGWQSWSVRAQALAHLGRRVEAAEALRRALRLAGDHPQAAYEAALVSTLIGDLAAAEAHAVRARRGGVAARWFELPFFTPTPADPAPRL